MNQTKTKIPKQSIQALIMLWLVFALNANGREILNRLTTYISMHYNVSADMAGMVGSAGYLGLAISSLAMTKFNDSFGHGWKRKYVNLIFSAGFLIFTALCGVNVITVSFGILVALQFVRGLFAGASDSVEMASVSEWFPREKVSIGLGIHHTGYPWGAAIGGLLITGCLFLFGEDNWKYCFFIFPILGIVIWIIYFKWASKKRYEKFEEETRAQGMTTPLGGEVASDVAKPAPGLLKRCLKNPNIIGMSVIGMFAHVAYIGFSFWLPYYLAFQAGYDYAAAASLSLVFTITAGVGQIVWGILADRFGIKHCMCFCFAWLAVAYFMVQFVNVSFFWLIALQLIVGCCSNGIWPMMYSFVGLSAEKGGVGTATSILNVGLYIGACVATPIVGLFIKLGGGYDSHGGYFMAVCLFAICMIIAFVGMLLITREVNGKKRGKGFSIINKKAYHLDD